MCLDGVGKSDYLEETHADKGRTCKLHTEMDQGRHRIRTQDLRAGQREAGNPIMNILEMCLIFTL